MNEGFVTQSTELKERCTRVPPLPHHHAFKHPTPEWKELSLNSDLGRPQAQLLSHTPVSSLHLKLTCVKVACLFQNKLFLKIQTSLYTINPIFKISIGFSFDILLLCTRLYKKHMTAQVPSPSLTQTKHSNLTSHTHTGSRETCVCVCVCVLRWTGKERQTGHDWANTLKTPPHTAQKTRPDT